MQVSKWATVSSCAQSTRRDDDLKAGDQLTSSMWPNERWRADRREAALDRWPRATGRFLPITNSIGTRRTIGERLLRDQHSRLCHETALDRFRNVARALG